MSEPYGAEWRVQWPLAFGLARSVGSLEEARPVWIYAGDKPKLAKHTLPGKSGPVPIVLAYQEYTFQLDIARRLVAMLRDWWVASVVSKGNGAIRASRRGEYGVQANATNIEAMTKSMGQ